MDDKKHYIALSHHKVKYVYGEIKEEQEISTWIVSYKKEGKYFLCENKFKNKTLKMKSVENFIRIWIYDMRKLLGCLYGKEQAKVVIYLDNEHYSGYVCSEATPIPVELILKYIFLLKDIIEDDNKVDETTA
ncbi:hypothetical protein BJ944DRAFT_231422 [Cunninghamella echinulata]|nr:hypothetical protein BJ944DRAFT_231422 [Cunninghamella echinulata]